MIHNETPNGLKYYFSKINSPVASAASCEAQRGHGRSKASSESKINIKQSPGGTSP